MSRLTRTTFLACALLLAPLQAFALERLCDTAFEDCRQPLLDLIENEPPTNPDGSGGGIDVAFWFMEDARYSAALARAVARGVRVRVIFDTEALPEDPNRQFVAAQLAEAGIPMREKVDPGINHWKMMIFRAQNTVQFSGANHTSEAFVPIIDYVAYVDEVIYFTDKASLVASFKTMFDNVWVSTNGMMANYANVTTLERVHPIVPIDPQLNFPPFDSFRDRSTSAYRAENTRVDAIIYRITDRAHTDTLIENVQRGIPTRLITEPFQYRDESRLWHAWNVDRLYKAGQLHPIGGRPGIEIRHRLHEGLLHEKLSIMIGQGISVIGSSNWTSPSSEYQLEHNLFSTDPAVYAWSRAHFDRKWDNTAPAPETQVFVPLPPDRPRLTSPGHDATGIPLSVTLEWYAGPWAHRYDLYFGTNPNNLTRVIDDQELGPYYLSHTVSGLIPGTRYYWRVVSRTMADQTSTGDLWSFVTEGSAPSNVPPTVSLSAPADGAGYTAPASITLSANASDSDGSVVRVDFLSGSTVVASATSAPFTATWSSVPAGNYTLTARAVDNLGAMTSSAPRSISVAPGTSTLPAPWSHGDVGPVAMAGTASQSGGTWTVTGAGSDVWGLSDEFHFVHQLLTGDGSVTARVATLQPVHEWTKAGVMIRESLTAASPHAFMAATPGATNGLAFQRRVSAGGASTHTSAGSGAPPVWVRLTRNGHAISAFISADGAAWTLVGTDTVPMAATVYVGLAVTSHDVSQPAAATFTGVAVSTGSTEPPPNTPPSVTLTSPANGASFTAPASVSLSANASDSDGSVVRVDFLSGSTVVASATSAPFTTTWSNVPAGSYTLTARAVDNLGATTLSSPRSISVSPGTSTVPAPWSHGDVGPVAIAGTASESGGTWTVTGAGSDIWEFADEFHFVHQLLTGDGSITARVASLQPVHEWTKAGVMIRESLTAASPHAFMATTPGATNGLAFQRRVSAGGASTHTGAGGAPPAWVRLTRSGHTISAFVSADGASWTLIDTDTVPMAATVYVGLAVTSHDVGQLAAATFTGVAVSTTGSQPPNAPPSVTLTAPADGASFNAPASITVSADAHDSDGTIARVEFYAGGSLIGSDATAPYSMAWSGVGAGSYVITARAVDNAGAPTTSGAATVTVNGAEPGDGLPAGWTSTDVGAVSIAGSTSWAGGVFTLRGSGADIWDTADAFHFAYRTLTGDGTITGRIASLEFADRWTKAGVMIRASLSPGSAHAMMVGSPGRGFAFQRRLTDNNVSVNTAGPQVTAPYWVRLQRTGNTITASTSPDGSTWTVVGTDTIALPATVLIGLPITSHNDAVLATGALDNVTVTP